MATTAQLTTWMNAHKTEHAAGVIHKHDPAPVPPPPTSGFFADFLAPDSRWRPTYVVGDAGYGLDSDFLGSLAQVSIANGLLTIKAERKATPSGRAYASASISANYAQAFGTWEARFRYGKGAGVWPAFWLLAQGSLQSPPEIDVMEAYPGPGAGSSGVGVAVQTLHTAANPSRYFVYSGADLTLDFHVYRCVWTPTSMEFAVDGQVTGKLTSDIPQGPMFPIITLAMGAPGYRVDASTPAVVTMDIDWLRVS